jgi:flagellar protein FlgJ
MVVNLQAAAPAPVQNLAERLQGATAAKPSVAATVQHMAGMLWYQMLSAMNENGLSPDTLGTGGDSFQSMFMWNLAQNDFGKYDTGLIAAATRQLGGAAATVPAQVPQEPVGGMLADLALPLAQLLPAMDSAQSAALSAPQAAALSGDLVSQAKSFAKTVWPQIKLAAQSLGVPAVAVLAQTALETGWGVSAGGNNLFGIKAADGETGSVRATHEMVDGVLTPQTARFRDYASPSDAVNDYIGLIQSGYQNAAGQGTVAGFAQALQAGGYATDQAYAAKIVNIAQSPLMADVLAAVGTTPSSSTSSSSIPSSTASNTPSKTGGP